MDDPPLLTRERVYTWAILTAVLGVAAAYKGDGWMLGVVVSLTMAACSYGLEALFRRVRAPSS